MAGNTYLVSTAVVSLNGTKTHTPMAGYDSMDLAERAREEMKKETAAMLEGQIVVKTSKGAETLPVTVGMFLNQLGIASINHTIITVPVRGSVLVQPRSGLIIPGV